jgi:hypothetical protein
MTSILPILVAAAVALLIWGLLSMVADPQRKEKRQLNKRLSTDGRPAGQSA